MQFFAILAFAAAGVLAAPAADYSPVDLCPQGLYSSPLCCDVSVEGVIDVSCEAVSSALAITPLTFAGHCATKTKKPQCCVAPVADVALLCQNAPGAP